MGYGIARARGSAFEQLGFSGSGSGSTTTVTGSASAGVFGSLTSIGTTGFAYDGLILSIGSNAQRRGLVTLTANTGGADETIADSIPFCAELGANLYTVALDLPIRVPSGATIKAKVLTQPSGSSSVRVSVLGYASQAIARGFSQIISCTDLTSGDPSNLITLTSTVLTGWSTIAASTSAPIGWLWAQPIDTNTSMGLGTTGQIYIEVGWGAAASEQALFRVPFVVNADFGCNAVGIPCNIPKGTRLAARAQASTTVTTTIGMNCFGAVP